MMDITATALSGVQDAQARFDRAAVAVASGFGDPSDPASGIDTVDLSAAAVAMMTAKTQMEANLSVLKQVEDMQSQVVNLLA